MTTLITGGAGFIGSNLANGLLSAGERVRIVDDLSRAHVDRNLDWLRGAHGSIDFVRADVRDPVAMRSVLRDVTHVYHLAAQVAVTTSVEDPMHDFDVNARGTLVLLQAMRALPTPPSLVYTSTNKVYGSCADLAIVRADDRYEPADAGVRDAGLSESRPLEFHTPYGCAKGAADQYVLDASHTFGMSTCVFRMSCIYGPRQFGNEDQGWVAHFVFRALRGESIAIYGDGLQVRDALYVDDLVRLMVAARADIQKVRGHAFNVGGGPANTTSLLALLARLERSLRRELRVTFEPWRPADQRWYVSDIRKATRMLGWRPEVSFPEGVRRLTAWVGTMVAPGESGRVEREARAS